MKPKPETPLTDPLYAVLDFETTGLKPAFGHRACEVAVNLVSFEQAGSAELQYEVVDQFATLINPRRDIPASVQDVHGISQEMVAGQPEFHEIAGRIINMLSGNLFVAHYANFDLSFLQSELQIAGYELPDFEVLDTCQLARNSFDFQSNSLENLAESLGFERPGHRALPDVQVTTEILRHFLTDLLQREDLHTLEDLFPYQGGQITIPEAESEVQLPPELNEALRNKEQVEIDYVSSKDRNTNRKITPLRTSTQNDSEYVIAYCHLCEQQRTFRLDRINKIQPA